MLSNPKKPAVGAINEPSRVVSGDTPYIDL